MAVTPPLRSRRVLVAIDDSPASERVATFVNAFFAGTDTEVLALSVARPAPAAVPMAPSAGLSGVYVWPYGVGFDELQRSVREQAERALEESPIDEDVALLERGLPADTIVRAAEEHDVDLIVVGSNHKGVFERILSPSVSKQIVKEADRPVLVVP